MKIIFVSMKDASIDFASRFPFLLSILVPKPFEKSKTPISWEFLWFFWSTSLGFFRTFQEYIASQKPEELWALIYFYATSIKNTPSLLELRLTKSQLDFYRIRIKEE